VLLFQFGQGLLTLGIFPEEEDRGLREGPREVGIPNLRASCPLALARRFLRTLDQAAIGDEILDAGEPLDIMDFIEKDETENFAEPGHGLEQIQGIGVVLLGGFDDVSRQIVEQRIIVPP
jgi:hypothetical protein